LKSSNRRLDAQYADELTRELNTYASADGVLAVSQKEADLVNDLTNDPQLAYLVPLMEDLPPSPLRRADRKGILFLGNFRHPPNVEAVAYFFQDVLPKVDSRVLDEHPIYLVGNALDDRVASLARGLGNIRLVGWVPSIVPYLHQSAITVAPLLSGAGTKTKVIQSLVAGTPTVSSSLGIEGLGLEHEKHAVVADNPLAFADGLTRLIRDASLWDRLAMAGREKILELHGRESVRQKLQFATSSVLSVAPKRSPDSSG
jgi:glycosyltransferase involved in cell wall biosynthesis